jgi:type IV pilus assembly protein PilW
MLFRPPRGVTLIELIVAMTVSAVVIAGVVGVVNAQQRAYFDGHRQRAAQSNGRAALIHLEQAIALAGYGMDAPLAFDFDRYDGAADGKCPADLDPCPRDAIANSDELVFHHRNPRYWTPEDYGTDPAGKAWRITALGSTSVTVNARVGDVFPEGQILQAVCRAGEDYAYFTVGENKQAATAGALTIPLSASDDADPFRRQNAATSACFTGGQARLFLVERKRFHVRPVANGDAKDPYLVLDTGVDVNLDGTIDQADEFVLAEGVELLQFAYVLTSNALPPRGTVKGTQVVFTSAEAGVTTGTGLTTLAFPGTPKPNVPVYGWTSYYGYGMGPPPHAARLTDHQANIRAVRIGLVARSPTVDPTYVGGGQVPLLFNMNALPAWIRPTDRYSRVTLETTVLARNMVTRAMPDF